MYFKRPFGGKVGGASPAAQVVPASSLELVPLGTTRYPVSVNRVVVCATKKMNQSIGTIVECGSGGQQSNELPVTVNRVSSSAHLSLESTAASAAPMLTLFNQRSDPAVTADSAAPVALAPPLPPPPHPVNYYLNSTRGSDLSIYAKHALQTAASKADPAGTLSYLSLASVDSQMNPSGPHLFRNPEFHCKDKLRQPATDLLKNLPSSVSQPMATSSAGHNLEQIENIASKMKKQDNQYHGCDSVMICNDDAARKSRLNKSINVCNLITFFLLSI